MERAPSSPARRPMRSDAGSRSPDGGNKRARRLSLRGKLFLLFGFPKQEHEQLAEELGRSQATLLGAPPRASEDGNDGQQVDRSVLFVVVNYWTEAAAPTQARVVQKWRESGRPTGRVETVTRFWVLEMARLGRWIDPRCDPFFRPPPLPPAVREPSSSPCAAASAVSEATAALLMTYPVNYKDDVDMEKEAEGEARRIATSNGDSDEKQTPTEAAGSSGAVGRGQSKRPMRLRLPCSPRYSFAQEVPVWPYVFGYLRQPLRSMRDLDAVIRALFRFESDRPFNCLETAIFKLMTHNEQQAIFERTLPELAKLVRQLPFLFPTPPPLLTPLFASAQPAAGSETTNGSNATTSAATAMPSDHASILSTTQSFTKEEVLALVSCCFFGIMPEQDRVSSTDGNEAGNQQEDDDSDRSRRRRRVKPRAVVEFPAFSMFRMFLSPPASAGPKIHKLRCVLQYFLVATKQLVEDRSRLQKEVITFSRIAIAVPPEAGTATKDTDGYGSDNDSDAIARVIRYRISRLAELRSPQQDRQTPLLLTRIRSEPLHLIEDLDAHLQMDFANKYPGGGVLGGGCVQEEIRFVLSPELLISCLVTAKLEPHEAFAIHGTERYCSYSGYGGSFEMSGPFNDQTPFEDVNHYGNACRRRRCVTVGVDATDYGGDRKGSDRQFSRAHMWRDLLKAFAGFAYGQERDCDNDSGSWPVATGNWGCGVFRGDPELKLLLQWLAASLAGRELIYVLLKRDELLKERLAQLTELMTRLEWHISVQWLIEFLFRRDGGEDDGRSLWGMVRERHSERRRQREGLRSRRGGGGMGYGRGGSMGNAFNDEDGGGSGVLAMAIEALGRELRSQSSSADLTVASSPQDIPDAAGDHSEDMEVDDDGGIDAAAPASAEPAAPKKQKKYAQATMDMFFK